MTTPLDPIPGPPAKSKGDLGTRTLSAFVMVAVAGTALWLGGWVFTAFVVAVGLGVLWEWWGLVQRIAKTPLGAAVWMVAGVSYLGVAMAVLVAARQFGWFGAVAPIVLVIAVDVGAYFAGRTFGGPKIAPSISPSKTWAGLIGGATLASPIVFYLDHVDSDGRLLYQQELYTDPSSHLYGMAPSWPSMIATALVMAALIAIIAQSGDFFESWMKRRAGVKDSGNLIPGHGGLFDRVDGLLAVLFVGGVLWLAAGVWA